MLSTFQIASIKYAALLLAIFSICLFNSVSSGPAYASKPYNAKTVEECINEKQCVWQALHQALMNKTTTKLYPGKYVTKWNTAIVLKVVPPTAPDKFDLDELIKQLQLHFTHGIGYENTVENFYVIFGEDLNKAFFVTHKKSMQAGFGDMPYKMHPEPITPDERTLSFTVASPVKGIQGYITFVKTGTSVRYNLASTLMEAMSLPPGKDNIFPFSGFAVEPEKFKKLSDLDLLLVDIMYDDEIPHGIAIESVKPIFDKIYEKNLANFKNKRALFPPE